jgi:LPXTG-site transpeptidase (sortase) family protein
MRILNKFLISMSVISVTFFTVGPTIVSAATDPGLGAASTFSVLSQTAITSVPTSSVSGDVGMNNFSSNISGLTATEVAGTIYATDAVPVAPGEAVLSASVQADGSAVIDGHYGFWENGKSAVFNDLNKLKKGDEIYVEDEKGNTVIFVGRKIAIYNPDEDASNVFASSDGKAHLNLITCEGAWIKDLKTYSNRLVVFTDKK